MYGLSDALHEEDEEDIAEIADRLKASGIESVLVDVLNPLHDKQENSSDDTTRAMQRFNELAARSGAQACVIKPYEQRQQLLQAQVSH